MSQIWKFWRSFQRVFLDCLWSKFHHDPTKEPFHGCWINARNFEYFYFITTYVILMKLTTDIYLNKVFHLAKSWSVIHRVQEGVNKKNHKMSQQISYLATFRPFLNTSIKTIANAFPPLFGFFLAKETYPKAAQNHSLCWYKNIWKLNTGELQIRNQ